MAALFCSAELSAQIAPQLGEPPPAPRDVSGLPTGAPRKDFSTGNFSVNSFSREQVREFFNAAYNASTGVPMNSTAVISNCVPGTNAPAFYDSALLRINWYRAMAGVPAIESFNTNNCIDDQEAALMMSANSNLNHFPPSTWTCFTSLGAHAASNSNLALTFSGPAAINSFMIDFGSPNYPIGHRRWLLYPQTQIMGTGDVPAQGNYSEANATWVLDGNFFGPRPPTRSGYVSWPPPGYAPYQVIFPRWSFAYPNANFSSAIVTMKSNGVPISVAQEIYDPNSYGENTLVWVPMGLNASDYFAVWPFSGADTVYTVTISNVANASSNTYSYSVTVFDPAIPGSDYIPVTISGTNAVTIGQTNNYTITPLTNATSYEWLSATATPFNFFDGAENGLSNFTTNISPGYAVITNVVVASGLEAFHLAMPAAIDQDLTLNYTLTPLSNAILTFGSLLGLAATNQVAKVQASADGFTWTNLFAQAGDGSYGESAFTTNSISLGGFVGRSVLLRFDYSYEPGSYFPDVDSGFSGYYDGWYLDNISLTNCEVLSSPLTNSISSTNFSFAPKAPGNYALQASGVGFNGFILGWGPLKLVTAILPAPLAILLGSPTLAGSQVSLNFTIQSGTATNFHLVSATRPNGPWSTNASAALTTNTPGLSYRFTTATNGPIEIYRVKSP